MSDWSTADQAHLACQMCGKSCSSAFLCVGCEALCYCSNKHRQMHKRLGHDEEQCSRMKQQLLRSHELTEHQLQWPSQRAQDVCKWLHQLHCHALGLLQYCCPMHPAQNNPEDSMQHQQPEQNESCIDPAYYPTGASSSSSSSRSSSSNTRWLSLPLCSHQWEAVWAPLSAEAIPSWRAAWHDQPISLEPPPGSTNKHNSCCASSAEVQMPMHGTPTVQQQQQDLPTCWSEYYTSRQLPKSSPAALALHFPLTVWYCLAQLLPHHGRRLPPPGSRLQIIYLGPQAELLLVPVFWELSVLLPDHHIHLHMVGPDVPDQLHGKACSTAASAGFQGSLTISCWAGCFHDLLENWMHAASNTADEAAAATSAFPALAAIVRTHGPPITQPVEAAAPRCAPVCQWSTAEQPSGDLHMVFAANAGLSAFPSWVPTLQQLLNLSQNGINAGMQAPAPNAPTGIPGTASAPATVELFSRFERKQEGHHVEGESHAASSGSRSNIPVLFSDYCEEAAVSSQQMVEGLFARGFDVQCSMNPFRQPIALSNHGTRLPAISNGFLFGWL